MIPEQPVKPASSDVPLARPVTAVAARPAPAGPYVGELHYAQPVQRMPMPISRLRAIVELLLLIPAGWVGIFAVCFVFRRYRLPYGQWLPVASSLAMGLTCLLACGLMLRLAGHKPMTIGWTARHLRANVGIGLVALLLSYLVMIQVACAIVLVDPGIITEEPESQRAIEATFPPLPFWGSLLMITFVAVWEETVFRGFLLTRLYAVLRRWWLVIPVGAVIFAGIHTYQGLLAVIIVGFLSMLLGTLFVWRKSLAPLIVFHLVFNVVTFQTVRWLSSTWQ